MMGNLSQLRIIHIYCFIDYPLHVHYVPDSVQKCTVITPRSSLHLGIYKQLQCSNLVSVGQGALQTAIAGQSWGSPQVGKEQRAMNMDVFSEDMKHGR